MYTPFHNPPVQRGWQCPTCGNVYAPTTPMCFSCPQKTQTSTGTGVIDQREQPRESQQEYFGLGRPR